MSALAVVCIQLAYTYNKSTQRAKTSAKAVRLGSKCTILYGLGTLVSVTVIFTSQSSALHCPKK